MGLGTYLGYFISQNGRGHVLGHVKDVGDDPTQIDRVRIYRTTARQFFHADPGDIVGLLCVCRAQEGGESDIVSVHHVWNTLQREHPDVAELLAKPVWYFDRKGETSEGEEEWIKTSVFYIEPRGKGRVYCKWDPYFVRSLTRFSDKGLIPSLSEEQVHALTVLEEVCQKLSLHMVLEVGDIQFLSDAHVLHARTAYKGMSQRIYIYVCARVCRGVGWGGGEEKDQKTNTETSAIVRFLLTSVNRLCSARAPSSSPAPLVGYARV